MALLCVLPLSSAQIPAHPLWETVPLFFHGCNFSGPFSPAAAAAIASRFASATVEKGQGLAAPDNATVRAEAHMLAAALQLKALRPSLPIVAYFNAFLNWEMYQLAEDVAADPSLALHEDGGALFLVGGDPAFPQPAGGMAVFDFTTPRVQQWFAGACLRLVASGAFDGCFNDRSLANGGLPILTNVSPARAAAWNAGHVTMMLGEQAALAEAGGFEIGNGASTLVPGLPGLMLENFTSDEPGILLLQGFAAQGLLVHAHAGFAQQPGYCAGANLTSALAAFLMGAGDSSFFLCCTSYRVELPSSDVLAWPEEYSRPLGKPLGLGARNASSGVWTRAFASGTVVTFDPASNVGGITWGQ